MERGEAARKGKEALSWLISGHSARPCRLIGFHPATRAEGFDPPRLHQINSYRRGWAGPRLRFTLDAVVIATAGRSAGVPHLAGKRNAVLGCGIGVDAVMAIVSIKKSQPFKPALGLVTLLL